MNDGILQCPNCKHVGKVQIRPWQTENGIFGAISVWCDECEWLGILQLNKAVELKFKVPDDDL